MLHVSSVDCKAYIKITIAEKTPHALSLEWTNASQWNPYNAVHTLASQMRKPPQRCQNAHPKLTASRLEAEISLKGKPTFITYAFGPTSLEEIIIIMAIFVW